jgi:transposase
MVYMGVDLHRRFCYLTALDARGQVLWQGQVANDAASLKGYFARWAEPVEVAVEACSFWPAFVVAIQSQVARIVLVHAQRVKVIASAKLKNDRVDSATLAHLLRTHLLPEAWMADLATRELRQATRLRVSLGRERTRWKNQVHAVLHQQGRRPPASDLFGRQGRKWLAEVNLPPMARHAVDTYLGLID